MKKIWKIMLSICIMITALMAMRLNAFADEYNLTTNDTWVSGSISTKGQANFYNFTIGQAGYVTVAYQGWNVGYAYYGLYTYDMTKSYFEHYVKNSTDVNPKTSSESIWLEAGQYVIRVSPESSYMGDYKVKARFSAANNNETEPNDKFNEAMPIGNDQLVTGLLSADDRIDFYKVALNSKQTIQFTYLAYIGRSYFEIWNSDFQSIYSKYIGNASEDSPKTNTYEVTLDSGIYYVKIQPNGNSDQGRYSLKYLNLTKAQSIANSNNKKLVAGQQLQLKATVSPSNATDKRISWSSDNRSVATVDENTGKVTTYAAGTAHITASALDGSKVTKSITLVVKPKKVGSLSISRSYYSKAMYVSWASESGANGYQICYSKNKNFKSAKKKNLTYSGVTLQKLTKNKKYYVKVRAYINVGSKKEYGAWSKVKTYKVKR